MNIIPNAWFNFRMPGDLFSLLWKKKNSLFQYCFIIEVGKFYYHNVKLMQAEIKKKKNDLGFIVQILLDSFFWSPL